MFSKFRKFTAAAAAVAALSFAAPSYASHCWTQYVSNTGFAGTSNWTFANGAYVETGIDDPCDIYFGYMMSAASLTSYQAKVSQTFTTGSHVTTSPWTMSVNVQAPTLAGASYWDELKVLVENLTTGQSEVAGLIKGSQLTSTCQGFDFTLTNNYANSQVRITINSQPFTQLDLYVDNIGFWGPNC